MSSSNDEAERLKRLRERQLADRDPLVKGRKQQQFYAQREKKRSRKPIDLRKMWSEIPHTFRNTVYAILVGLLGVLVLPALWDSPWALAVVGGVTLVLIIFGVTVGHALDLRDELKDNIRH